MKVTILGCGGSAGVPLIGNDWGQCDPADPRNRRRRPSILVEDRGTVILIDTTPELHEQLNMADVRRIDAVLWTHAHADHVHGLDDLRGVNLLMQAPIDAFADKDTLDSLTTRFGYCFTPLKPNSNFYYKPVLVPHEITGPFNVRDTHVVPFDQEHGWMKSLGFRFGRFAYSTDVVRLDEAAFAALEGIDTWVVDCLRVEPHPVHAHLELTLSWIERLRPRRAYLTHMGNSMDYETIRRLLPPGVEPAYDGQVIGIPD